MKLVLPKADNGHLKDLIFNFPKMSRYISNACPVYFVNGPPARSDIHFLTDNDRKLYREQKTTNQKANGLTP